MALSYCDSPALVFQLVRFALRALPKGHTTRLLRARLSVRAAMGNGLSTTGSALSGANLPPDPADWADKHKVRGALCSERGPMDAVKIRQDKTTQHNTMQDSVLAIFTCFYGL